MLDFLDDFYDIKIDLRKAIMKSYGWAEQNFDVKSKRKEVFDSLKKMKSAIDYASYYEIKYGYGLAEGRKGEWK